MSKALKTLIIIWVIVGYIIIGAIGFYVGRMTAPEIPFPLSRNMNQPLPPGAQPFNQPR